MRKIKAPKLATSATVAPKPITLAALSKPASKPATVATATAKPATATAPVPVIAADKPTSSGSGYINRAATLPQLYGAETQSGRDIAYLRFFASFLRGRKPDSVITLAEIAERQRPADMRNPLPGAGGKNGCIDRGILSRFVKFGYTVNVSDPTDKTRRLGFRFTDTALTLAPVIAGMRDTYANGRPVTS
jgi:hypothetical protein